MYTFILSIIDLAFQLQVDTPFFERENAMTLFFFLFFSALENNFKNWNLKKIKMLTKNKQFITDYILNSFICNKDHCIVSCNENSKDIFFFLLMKQE